MPRYHRGPNRDHNFDNHAFRGYRVRVLGSKGWAMKDEVNIFPVKFPRNYTTVV